ncbi:MAG TPA: MFS transporter [Mycobacteriales bacterium]|nr:MFS transporter [Mycobacteriales bacterium]
MSAHALDADLPPSATGEWVGGTRRLLVLLGLPTFGLAFAISVLTTYGPVVLLDVAGSPSAVGGLIGAEGAFALVIPLLVGFYSDRLPRSGLARRVPFLIAGTPLIVVGLVLLPLWHSFLLSGAMVFVFFVGYYLYYPPYRAMYADLLPRHLFARSQSGQAIARGSGLGAALLVGGLLLGWWAPLPFIVAGGILVGTTLALLPVIHLERVTPVAPPSGATPVGQVLLHDRGLRTFAVANALWEFSFAGLKSFIVLYVVKGLGHSSTVASGVIAVVAVAYVVGAPIAGQLADKFGMVPVMAGSAAVFGTGLTLGVIPTTLAPGLILLPLTALAGSILLTLPQALAFVVAPEGSEGAAAGLVDFSRGIGVVLGPVLVGVAVGNCANLLPATHGYAAMWPVIGIPVLLSVVLMPALHRYATTR